MTLAAVLLPQPLTHKQTSVMPQAMVLENFRHFICTFPPRERAPLG